MALTSLEYSGSPIPVDNPSAPKFRKDHEVDRWRNEKRAETEERQARAKEEAQRRQAEIDKRLEGPRARFRQLEAKVDTLHGGLMTLSKKREDLRRQIQRLELERARWEENTRAPWPRERELVQTKRELQEVSQDYARQSEIWQSQARLREACKNHLDREARCHD